MTITATAPTSQLPPISRIHQYPPEDLSRSLRYLRQIYNQEVRGIRRIGRKPSPKAVATLHGGAADTPETDRNLDTLRSDSFERSYAIRWLTALVAQSYRLLDSAGEDSTDTVQREALIQDAASLLAICAGSASAGTVTRVFRFHDGQIPIEVQLTDVPLENQDYSSVGAQTWGSACLLADMLVEDQHLFNLDEYGDGLRALELGAGTGLAGLTLAKLLQARGTACSLVATDFHPSVLSNLRDNFTANFPTTSSVDVSVHALDWSKCSTTGQNAQPLDQPFDLILGADIIYEPEHARWIQGCVEKLLRRPEKPHSRDEVSHPPAKFHLVIPLRPTHLLESSTVEEVFPPLTSLSSHRDLSTLAVMSKDVIVCEAHGDVRSRNGAADQVEYAHYIIGWC